MFETVAPETFRKRSRRLFYETLPLSITIHALAIVGAVGATQWNVAFPDHSPRLTAQYVLAAVEPPPPPPPPAAPRPVQQVAPQHVPDDQIVAPTVIPDTIPVIAMEEPAPVAAPVVQPVEGGVEGGIEGGVLGGVVAAQIASLVPTGPVVEEDGRVHINRDAKLPMQSISQDYPMYPEDARMKGIEDSLVVRYVIGKDGRVKEVKVIDPPKYQQFADAATKAISHWRFQPLLENGQKTEVVHELTVFFQLK